MSDAESLLRMAADHAAGGRLDLALYTYLGAALRALDDWGAIRIARHRTHGEYVRGCTETSARPPLRDIVREVDGVRFGGMDATRDAVDRAGSRAVSIVRALAHPTGVAITTMVSMVLFLGACTGGLLRPGSDSIPGVTTFSSTSSCARGPRRGTSRARSRRFP